MNDDYRKHGRNILDQVWETVNGVKNQGYNGGSVSIRNYCMFRGPRDWAYMCHAKALRLISVTDPANEAAKLLKESAKDTCLDLIAYAMFTYCEIMTREEESATAHENNHADKAKFMDSLSGAYKGEAKPWRPNGSQTA